MFKDEIKAKFIAGKGGNGKVSFMKGGKKPSGGIGGDGGNVYFEGVLNQYDLSHITLNGTYKADDGKPGDIDNIHGKSGKDLVFKVPLVTKVYDEQGKLIAIIDKPNEPKLILKGGRGGLGNYYFRSTGVENAYKFTEGEDGEVLEAKLELELFSDIILIGYPNAGKSSILNAITNAQSKVAPYEFTTLNPKLGRLNGITIMDLPGLIEGTYEGKGLGPSFVKHTKAAKVLAHLISIENEFVEDTYLTMRKEIENLGEDLSNKHEVIVLTKSDLSTQEDIEAKTKNLSKFNKEIYVCSVYDYDSLEGLKNFLTNVVSLIPLELS